MAKKRKKQTEKQKKLIKKRIIVCIFLCLFTILLSYSILLTDFLQPHINEMTASYISFNNRNTTDMLKIMNLKKMNDKQGNSIANPKSLEFNIEVEKDLQYEISIVPINNHIEEKYIHYALTINNNNNIVDKLSNKEKAANGERIIYQGKKRTNTKVVLRMWISKEYKKEAENVSFEIKVKSR